MEVSVLFNEPKLLKLFLTLLPTLIEIGFSALQRAEIAEIMEACRLRVYAQCFSALQRAEIAEIKERKGRNPNMFSFSALQRAEIAEI